MTNILMERALEYARRGLSVLPCKPSTKAPFVEGGLNSATTDPDVIRDWWARWPHAMIGVRMGEDPGVWALDPDGPDRPGKPDGRANWARLCVENGGCPPTHTHLTPNGGKHLLFKWRPDRPVTNSEGKLKGLGINVRGNGGYVIFPPSQRHDGKAYEVEDSLDHFNFAEAPEWLYELILTKPTRSEELTSPKPKISEQALATILPRRDARRYAEAALDGEARAVASARPGARNKQLNISAMKLAQLEAAGELSEGEVVNALYQSAEASGLVAEDGHRQTMATIASGRRKGLQHPRAIPEREPAQVIPMTQHADQAEQVPAADPVDLWAKFDPPGLPRSTLPDVIERFAYEQGRAMGADMAGIAVSALAVCAAAIPDKVKLQVKRHNAGWLESARLWIALVGPPSSMKSPTMAVAARPLRRMDADMARQQAEERSRYDKLPREEKAEAKPPKQARLVLQDTTVEAAQEILRDSPDGVLCYQDEMSGWFGAMDKYSGTRGSAKDRAFWLEAFNGAPYSVQRIGRGSVFIENLSISLIGGIQPEPIRKIAEDSVDDGLLQRLLPVMLKPAIEGCDEEESPVISEYGAMIGRLRHLDEIVLRFDHGAQAYRQELERKHLWLQSCETIHRKLAAHIGKYNGIFARLCVVWHCAEHAAFGKVPPEISEGTARRAGGFLHRFLLPHAVAFYAGVLGLSSDHDSLTAVAAYILAHKLTKITNRDVKRGDRIMGRLDPHQIEAVFEQLEALGWIDRVTGPRPTAPSHWAVNQVVHEKFAERAKAEAERRASDRKMIAEILGGQIDP
jgi:hypothetical protein